MFLRRASIALTVAAVFCAGCQQKSEEAAPEYTAEETTPTTTGAYPDCESSEIPYDLASQDQPGADGFAWGSFNAYIDGGTPAWSNWPSTVDMIDCNQDEPPARGICDNGRFIPHACRPHYTSGMMILDQVGKVDDEFLEATTRGLSADPVLANDGTFVRYLIVISPETQDWILSQELQKESTLQNLTAPIDFPCSTATVPGSNSSSTILKLAWMETASITNSDYYTQDVLVYTPGYRNSTGVASCEPKTMALVGLHLLRKTETQNAWVWGTFEHALNAPDCTGLPPAPAPGGSGPATSCPSTASTNWNFYSIACQPDGSPGPCQNCNIVPAQNGDPGECVNPNDPTGPSWCLDKGFRANSGLSRICRQVAPGNYYSGATSWDATPPNAACQPDSGVWSNYQLISTQWIVGQSAGGSCPNVQSTIYDGTNVQYSVIAPQVAGVSNHPFLGNTSMESYERSNCMGCHSKTTVDESGTVTANGTDFVYFFGLEVPGFEPAPSGASE